jgi:hypothetical protein
MSNKLSYSGIGSRDIPLWAQDQCFRIAQFLANNHYTLRSGGADGADKSFELGCDSVGGNKEIYLPWSGFNNSTSRFVVCNPKAFEIAQQFHPAWNRLSQGARKLHARNTHQVLGFGLRTPVQFVVCFTPNASGSGGTGQALRIAKHYNIPIFDIGAYSNPRASYTAFLEFFNKLNKSTNL